MRRITVLLVHGMGRTPASMWRLARTLRGNGFVIRYFAYATAWQSVDEIIRRLRRRVQAIAGDEYVVVGHSLGGVLLRAALADLPPGVRPPRHIIMLGTPNQSPRLARRFEHAWWYRLLNGDAGDLLARESRLAAIPRPDVPCTVIAGTRGLTGRWSPFGTEANDGLVAVSETRLDGAEEWIALPVRHPFMMNDGQVTKLIVERCGGTGKATSKK